MINRDRVKILKLLSGELVIAEVMNANTDLGICIENPLSIVIMPPRNQEEVNKPGIALMPWVDFTNDKHFDIRAEHVVLMYTPTPPFIDEYAKRFSGLITQSKQLILPG